MEVKKRTRKTWWLLVLNIVLSVVFFVALAFTAFGCYALLRTKPASFFDDAGLWEGDGFTLQTYGEEYGEDGYLKPAEGTITLDNVTYKVMVGLFRPRYNAVIYLATTEDGSEVTDINNATVLFDTYVSNSMFSENKAVIEIRSDYMAERYGTADHTGEKFTLYRQ